MLTLVAIVSFTLGWGLCLHLSARALRFSDLLAGLLTKWGKRDRVAILHSTPTPAGFELHWVHLDAPPLAEAMRGKARITFQVTTRTTTPDVHVEFVPEP